MYEDYNEKLEREYEELLFKLRSSERTHAKEMMEMKILYQSEKEKAESLEQSLSQYPQLMLKVRELQNKLKSASNKIKLQKTTIEELTSSHSQKHIVQRLETELQNFRESSASELRAKELANQKLTTELEQYKRAVEQFSMENRSIRQTLNNEKDEKEDILQQKLNLETNLKEAKGVIVQLNEQLLDRIQEIKDEEDRKSSLRKSFHESELDKFQAKIADYTEEINALNSKIKELKTSRNKVAEIVQQHEQTILTLKQDKDILTKEYKAKEKQVLELQGVIENQAEDVEAEMELYRQETAKESNALLKEAKEFQRELQSSIDQRDEQIYALEINVRDLKREIESNEMDKSNLKEKIKDLETANRELRNKLQQTEENTQHLVNQAKEELSPLILRLKSDKRELEHRIDELINQIEVTRNSIMTPGATLFDEISEEPDNEVVFFCRQSIGQSQKVAEDLRVELSQKDYDLKILLHEKGELAKEIDRLYAEKSNTAEAEEQLALMKKNGKVMKKENKALEKENARLRDDIVDVNALNTDLKATIKYFEVKGQEMEASLTQVKTERDSFQIQVDELLEKTKIYEQSDKDTVISELNKKLRELEESSKEIQDKLKGKIRCLKDDYYPIKQEFDQIAQDLRSNTYESATDGLRYLVNLIDRELGKVEEDCSIIQIENQIQGIESALALLGKQIQTYKVKADSSHETLENMKKDYSDKENQLVVLKNSYTQASFTEFLKKEKETLKSRDAISEGKLSEIIYSELVSRDKTIIQLLKSKHEMELLCEKLQSKPTLALHSDHLSIQIYSNEKQKEFEQVLLEKETDCKRLQSELNQIVSELKTRKDNIDISRLSDVNLEQSSKEYSIDSIYSIVTIPSTTSEKAARIDLLLSEIEVQNKKYENLSKEHLELITDYQILEDYIHTFKNKSNIFEVCSQVEVLASQIENVRQSISHEEEPRIQEIQEECERLKKELHDLQESLKQQNFKLDISRRSEIHLENTKKIKLSSSEIQNNIQITAEKPSQVDELMKEIQSKNSAIDSLCKEHSELLALYGSLQEYIDALKNKTNIVEVFSQAEILATRIESNKHSISIETEPIKTIKKDLSEMISQTNSVSLDLSRRSEIHVENTKEFAREVTVENEVEIQCSLNQRADLFQKEIETKNNAIETLCKEQSELISQCQSLQEDLDKFKHRTNIIEVCSQAEVFASQLDKTKQSLSPERRYKIDELQSECDILKTELCKLAESVNNQPILDISRRSEVNLEQILKQKEMSYQDSVEILTSVNNSQQIEELQKEVHTKNDMINTLCRDHSDLVTQYQNLQENIENARNKEKIIEFCSSAEILAFKLGEARKSFGESTNILETQQECEKLRHELETLRKNINTQERTLDISRRSEIQLEKTTKLERNLTVETMVEIPSTINAKEQELLASQAELENKISTIKTLKKEQDDLKLQCQNLQEVIDSFKNRSRITEVCSQAEVIASQIESARQSLSPEDQNNIIELQQECENLRNELEKLRSKLGTFEIARRSDVSVFKLSKLCTISSELPIEIKPKFNLKSQQIDDIEAELRIKQSTIDILQSKLDSQAKKPVQLVEVSEFHEPITAESKQKDVLADIHENQLEESKEVLIERLTFEKGGLENERESLQNQKDINIFKKTGKNLMLDISEINNEFERSSEQSNFTLSSPSNSEVLIQANDFQSPRFNANINLLEVEAERDRYKAEMQKLKAQLTLNMQNMAFSNNQLNEQLEKEQKELVRLQVRVKKLEERDAYYRKALEDKKNKMSWWKKKFGGKKNK